MKIWLPVLVSLALTACAGGSRINHFDYDGYSGSTAYFAALEGKMVLAVYGSPVAGNPADLSQAVADALHGTHVDASTVFVPTAAPDLTGYRTVVVFGRTTPETICTVKDSAGLATGSPTEMLAAFCNGDETLSYVSGAVPAIANANSTLLASHMSLVGFTLFPAENPHYESDCGSDAPICRD